MQVAGLELHVEPNGTNLLVIYSDVNLTNDDAFALLCRICAINIDEMTKIYWFRHEPPTSIPEDFRLQPWQLSRITLRYFHSNLVAGIVAFCASAHTSTSQAAIIVEFYENDIVHEESLSTILALLSDLSNHISSVYKHALSKRNLFVVTALIRTSQIFHYALVTTLYTNCILHVENGVCKAMIS